MLIHSFNFLVFIGGALFFWVVVNLPLAALGFGLVALGVLIDGLMAYRRVQAGDAVVAGHACYPLLRWTRHGLMGTGLVVAVAAFWFFG